MTKVTRFRFPPLKRESVRIVSTTLRMVEESRARMNKATPAQLRQLESDARKIIRAGK